MISEHPPRRRHIASPLIKQLFNAVRDIIAVYAETHVQLMITICAGCGVL
jgi:hypothetical protein